MAFCVVLTYFVVWQRGLYSDDYLLSTIPISPLYQAGERVFGIVIIAALSKLLLVSEFAARLIQTAVTCADALLTAYLVFRLLRSQLAALVAGLIVLIPLFGSEGVLWICTTHYGVAMLFGLGSLHAFYSALTRPRSVGRMGGIALIAYVSAVLCIEGVAGLLVVHVCLALIVIASLPSARWAALRKSVMLIGLMALGALLIYLLLYRGNSIALQRGTLNLDPAWVADQFRTTHLPMLYELTIDPQANGGLLVDSFGLGQSLIRSGIYPLLLGLTCLSLALAVVKWRYDRPAYSASIWKGVGVLACGIVWLLVCTLFPTILLDKQWFASRLLYFPTFGLGVALAAVSWLLLKLIPFAVVGKLILLAAGAFAIVSAIIFVGIEQIYLARYQLDQQQVDRFVANFPPIPEVETATIYPITFTAADTSGVPFKIAETGLFDYYLALNAWVSYYGHYDRVNFVYLNPYHLNQTFRAIRDPQTGEVTMLRLPPFGDLPVGNALPIVYRNGDMFAILQMPLLDLDGNAVTVFFPQVRALHQASPQTPVLLEFDPMSQ